MKNCTAILLILLILGCFTFSPQKEKASDIRALYLPATKLSVPARKMAFASLQKYKANAIVLDIKDIDGTVALPGIEKEISLATERLDGLQLALSDVITEAKKEGLYVIGRITLFRDGCLIKKKPEWAIRNKYNKLLLTDDIVSPCGPVGYISPLVPEAVQYNIALAKKAVQLGVDEVQIDYVRFPDAERAHSGIIPSDRIAEVVKEMHEAIAPTPLSVDIFGFASVAPYETIGQDAKKIAQYAEVICPMVYPSLWKSGDLDLENPEASPEETIYRSLTALRAQLPEKTIIRPWYEAGDWGTVRYGKKEIDAQIRGGERVGVEGWTLWNSEGDYY